jgi:hypothetical protein
MKWRIMTREKKKMIAFRVCVCVCVCIRVCVYNLYIACLFGKSF